MVNTFLSYPDRFSANQPGFTTTSKTMNGMDSPSRNVFKRHSKSIAWGDMIIVGSNEDMSREGEKYTKYYDTTESIATRSRRLCLRPFRFLRSLCNERRREAISHNWANSTFYKLPVEILHIIAGYLPPAAILSLRRVGTKLRTCLAHFGPEIKAGSLFKAEVCRFVYLLRQDKLYE